mmetsp:Transcript_4320/g.16250  ORF Transcript_4320/g.16250 Transcript_4320/m.16250 type:complete len:562 (+) Transcript_4320:202-1887(+)
MIAQMEVQAPPGLEATPDHWLSVAAGSSESDDTAAIIEAAAFAAASSARAAARLSTATDQEFKGQLVKEVTEAVQLHVEVKTAAAVDKLWQRGEKAIRLLQKEQASHTESLQGQLAACAESYRNLERENASLRQSLESLMKHLTMILGPPPSHCTQLATPVSPAFFPPRPTPAQAAAAAAAAQAKAAAVGQVRDVQVTEASPTQGMPASPNPGSPSLPVSPSVCLGMNVKYPKAANVARMDPCFEAPDESEEFHTPSASPTMASSSSAGTAAALLAPPGSITSSSAAVAALLRSEVAEPDARKLGRPTKADAETSTARTEGAVEASASISALPASPEPTGTSDDPAHIGAGTSSPLTPLGTDLAARIRAAEASDIDSGSLTPSMTTPPPNMPPPPAPTPPPMSHGAGVAPGLVKDQAPVFTLTLRRADNVPVGLDVRGDPKDVCLTVEQVRSGGAVEAWNRQCAGDSREIRPGDRIIMINNAEDAKSMREECLTKHLLRMTVLRGCGAPTPIVGRAAAAAAAIAAEAHAPTPQEGSERTPIGGLRAEAHEFVPQGGGSCLC